MDDSQKQKLVEKVLKLFVLGDKDRNLSEAEAEAAATKARQLMLEHALSEVDLETYGTAKAQKVAWLIREHTAYTLKRPFAVYDNWISSAVCAITDTDCIIRTTHRVDGIYRSRIFIGTDADVSVASSLFLILLDTLRRMARQRYGPGWTRAHSDYGNGLSMRLAERAREAHMPDRQLTVGQCETLALVVRDKKDAVNEFMNKNLKLKKARRRVVYETSAFHEGRKDAESVDLNAKRRIG